MLTIILSVALTGYGTAVEAANPVVLLDTSMGKITLELNPDKAPKTVENFLAYVADGHYNNTIFHRVIADFMIQGGGFTRQMTQKPTKTPIVNEADNGLSNTRGTIAMARTSDPHSATAQFFINLKDNAFLNHKGKDLRGWGYAVFGKVIDGMEVVDAIGRVKTGSRGMLRDVPLEDVLIKSATLKK